MVFCSVILCLVLSSRAGEGGLVRRSRFSDSHPDRSACCSLSLMLETISGRRSPAPDQRPCLPCLKPPGRIRASRPCARSSWPAACAGTTSHCSFTGEDVAGLLDATGLAPLRTPLKRSHGGHRICGEALHSPRGVITFLSNALTAFSAGSPQRASESGSDGPAEDDPICGLHITRLIEEAQEAALLLASGGALKSIQPPGPATS